LVQSNASTDDAGNIALGQLTGGAGFYTLGGGILSSQAETYGVSPNSTGSFNQTGGTHIVAGSLIVAELPATSSSTYSLENGGLSVASATIGYGGSGQFIQTGGTNSVTSTLTIGGQNDLMFVPMPGSGSYTLGGVGSLSASTLLVGAGGNGTFTQTGGSDSVTDLEELDIAQYAGSIGWYFLAGGSCSADNVYVGGYGGGAGGAGNLTVSGSGSLNVNNTLTVYNTSGSSLVVNGGSVTAGTLSLLGQYTQTAGSATFGQIMGTGQANISGGTTTLEAVGTGSQIGGLIMSGSGTLDMNNNALIINYGSNPDPISSIVSYLTSGYAGGNWDGPGINSSLANQTEFALGYADSADPDNPAGLSSGQIEIKYTLYGDANLDGSVNSVDFGILAANFGKSGKSWDQGAFTYNGTVNSIDFGLLAANFGKSVGDLNDVVTAADWAALDAFAEANGLTNEVPEPMSAELILLSLGGAVVLRKRRLCFGTTRGAGGNDAIHGS